MPKNPYSNIGQTIKNNLSDAISKELGGSAHENFGPNPNYHPMISENDPNFGTHQAPQTELRHQFIASLNKRVNAFIERHRGDVTDPEHDMRLKENKEKREREKFEKQVEQGYNDEDNEAEHETKFLLPQD